MARKYGELTKEILLYFAMSGVILVAATSPYFLLNLARAIIRNRKYIKKQIETRRLVKALERLKKNRLIILSEENEKFRVELTEKGKRVVKEIQFEKMRIEKPKFWDGKWRVIIFDIPEKFKKRARDALREKLKELGFYQLQKSVWVFPYPCEKEIQFLCELFGITPYVNIIEAESISNDIKLRKHFNLI